jgi:hypothetical protein
MGKGTDILNPDFMGNFFYTAVGLQEQFFGPVDFGRKKIPVGRTARFLPEGFPEHLISDIPRIRERFTVDGREMKALPGIDNKVGRWFRGFIRAFVPREPPVDFYEYLVQKKYAIFIAPQKRIAPNRV